MAIIYFRRGYLDGIDAEDREQIVGVDSETFEVTDAEELMYRMDLPSYRIDEEERIIISGITSEDDLIDVFEEKGWEMQES